MRDFIEATMNHLEQWARDVVGRKRLSMDEWREHLALVTLEAFQTYSSHPSLYMGVSLHKEDYSGLEFAHLSYAYTRFVTEFLTGNGYLELFDGKKGWQNPDTGKGFRTRMKATPRLIDDMTRFGINRYMITRYPECPKEVIILRAEKQKGETTGKELSYNDTEFTRQARTHLRRINDFIGSTFLNLYLTDDQQEELEKRMMSNPEEDKVRHLDFTNSRLRRIFNNGSFEEGGRFYGGWWQQIPSEYRPLITINGKKTVELDYSGMHFAVMYALHGMEVPMEDPYALEGIDSSFRPFIKKAFNAIVNCTTEEQAIGLVDIKIAKGEWPQGLGDGQGLLRAFRKMHEPISDMIASAHGTKAQFSDSEIAERVMLKGLEDDLCILPVHDSFIVRAGSESDLRRYMAEAFEEVLGQTADMGLVELEDPSLLSTEGALNRGVTLKDGTEIEGVNSEQLDQPIIGFGEVVGVEGFLDEQMLNWTQYERRVSEWKGIHEGYID